MVSSRSRRTSNSRLSLAALAGVGARAMQPAAEFGALFRDPVFWGWGVPRGDGHAVLALPGLFAGDTYLEPLRSWLSRAGYTPIRSGLDRNPGWSEELVAQLGDIAEREFARDGRRLSIIGHSMGGLLGRSVAVRRPHAIAHVIALGAPLSLGRGRLPESVRLTAIYTRDDQIVRYPAATARDPRSESLEVRGSHVGLTGNPEVYRLLARLLRPAATATGR